MRKRQPHGAVSLAAGLLVMVALAGAALAGDVTGRDKVGDVTAAGLTKAERAALDIVSVRAIGEEGLGVAVVATFKGNVEKALGRGHLRNGLAAMILRPRSAAQKPAGLVTRGPGQGKTLRKTRSEEVAVARQGRKITFIVAGPGYSNVGRVEVKTFAKFVLGSARSLAQNEPPPVINDTEFQRLVSDEFNPAVLGGDSVTINVISDDLSCDELEELLAEVRRPFKVTAPKVIQAMLEDINEQLRRRCSQRPPPPPTAGLGCKLDAKRNSAFTDTVDTFVDGCTKQVESTEATFGSAPQSFTQPFIQGPSGRRNVNVSQCTPAGNGFKCSGLAMTPGEGFGVGIVGLPPGTSLTFTAQAVDGATQQLSGTAP